MNDVNDNINKIPKRRLSDNLPQDSDHDLLIYHSAKIDNLCRLVREMGKNLDGYITKQDERCESRRQEIFDSIETSSGDVMPKDTIKWILGFVILIIITMVGTVGYNQIKIQKNEGRFDECLLYIKKNQESIEKMQKILDMKMRILATKTTEITVIPKVSSSKQ